MTGVQADFVPDRVSVIVPTYNYGHFIVSALRSALNQRVADLEVIVVDDGSTDDTQKILEPYQDFIRYVYQENAGLSAARNTGIVHSTGEYLQFLDSDDLLGRDAIPARLRFLDSHPGAHVAVCRSRFFSDLSCHGRPVPHGQWRLHRRDLPVHLCQFNIAPPHAFLLHREAVADIGFFDDSLMACEDYDYWLRAVLKGYPPRFCGDGLVYYRRHGESMSANKRNQVHHDAIMHRRLFDRVCAARHYASADMVGSRLAFAAGLLATLSRTRWLSSRDLRMLSDLARDSLPHLLDLMPGRYGEMSTASRIYFAKIARWLKSRPELVDIPYVEPYRRVVNHWPKVRVVLGNLLSRDATIDERWRLLRMAF